MRALVWNGPNDMVVEEIERPSPGPGDVLVRISKVGICGSDVHGFSGATGRRTPGMVMGHEFAGVVEELGPGAGGEVRAGDRVAANPMATCGECEYCRSGLESICPDRRVLGVNMGKAGAFSEYVTVPVGNVVRLADSTTDEEGAMIEPLAVGLRAVNLSGLRDGEPTFLLGAGTIGLCILLVCRSRGIGPVYVTDLVRHRLELASALGGHVLPVEDHPLVRVQEATGGGVPASLDAVGVSATIRQALEATRRGGRIVIVGLGAPTVDLGLYDLVPQERTIVGSYAYSNAEYREAARLVNERVMDVRPLVERTVSFEDTPRAFLSLSSGEDQSVKVMIEVDTSRTGR